jgi:hypothetical protein
MEIHGGIVKNKNQLYSKQTKKEDLYLDNEGKIDCT